MYSGYTTWSYHTLTLFRFSVFYAINMLFVNLALRARLGVTSNASEFFESQFVLWRAVSPL